MENQTENKFKNRTGKNLNRRKLTILSQEDNEMIVDVSFAGTIENEGSKITAEFLNEWEDSINNSNQKSTQAVQTANSALTKANETHANEIAFENSMTNSFNTLSTTNSANISQFKNDINLDLSSFKNQIQNSVTNLASQVNGFETQMNDFSEDVESAVTTANTIAQTAQNAVSIATQAQSASTTAQTVANGAKTKADSIQTQIDNLKVINTLEGNVRIWNLDDGIYYVKKNASVYYNGASGGETTAPNPMPVGFFLIVTSTGTTKYWFAPAGASTNQYIYSGQTTSSAGTYSRFRSNNDGSNNVYTFTDTQTGPGYIKFPNGLIICWGYATISGVTQINLPYSFKDTSYQVVASPGGAGAYNYGLGVEPYTQTAIKARYGSSTTIGIRYIAIGF